MVKELFEISLKHDDVFTFRAADIAAWLVSWWAVVLVEF